METVSVVRNSRIKTLHLFAGAGGGILADLLLGHDPVGAVEIEAYPRKVLLQRQIDGCLPEFPIWDDVRTFRSDNPDTADYIDRLRGIRHELAICGGFPCQDISSAGKGAGLSGERSGLFFEMARIISEIRPRYVFMENSPMLVSRGLHLVLDTLASLGYDARWGIVGAHHAGAPHKRDRIWIMAHHQGHGCRSGWSRKLDPSNTREPEQPLQDVADAQLARSQGSAGQGVSSAGWASVESSGASWWATEPELDRVAHGIPNWVDRLKAIGNGQVPSVAKIAWSIFDVN